MISRKTGFALPIIGQSLQGALDPCPAIPPYRRKTQSERCEMFSKTAMNGEPGQTSPQNASQNAPQPGGDSGFSGGAQGPAVRSNATRSVLGSDLKITGEISSTGALEVMGEIDGNISADALSVGQNGRISGSVSAKSVEVNGRLDGKVDSEHFTMRASAQVTADVSYDTLIIESGASIEGRFTRNRG